MPDVTAPPPLPFRAVLLLFNGTPTQGRGLHSAGSKATALRTLRALSPGDLVPRLRRQSRRPLAQGHRLPTIIGPPGTASARSSPWLHALGRLLPNRRTRLHPHRDQKGCERLARRDGIVGPQTDRTSRLIRSGKPILLRNSMNTLSPPNGVTARRVSRKTTFFSPQSTLTFRCTVLFLR